MRLPRPIPTALAGEDLVALLDEHHLALVGDAETCRLLVDDLAFRLATQGGVQLIRVDGRGVRDLGVLTRRLAPGRPASLEADDADGFVELVRALRSPAEGIRRQFFVWSDADDLLARDQELFERLVDAVCTVAADREYLTDDPLVIQRLILTGGSTLETFARQWTNEQPPMLVCTI